MNPDPGSISQWVQRLQAGDRAAAEGIWTRFYPKLVNAASKQLGKNPDPATNGEDIAQSSFRNVCQAVIDGKYPQLDNRDDLWKLLFVSMINRVRGHYRGINAKKRAVVLNQPLDSVDEEALAQLDSHEAQSELNDLLEHLLGKLDQEDPTGELRQIALLYLNENSASAIANLLRRRKTNILHKVQLIRSLWEEALCR